MNIDHLRYRAAQAAQTLSKAADSTERAAAEREALSVKSELEQVQRDAALTKLFKLAPPESPVMMMRRRG